MGVPEQFVKQPDPEEIELGGQLLEGRHEVRKEAEVDMPAVVELEDIHELDVLQVCVDAHVEVVEVGRLHPHQLLIELWVFLALLDDIGLLVRLVLHHLLREIHRFDCFDYYIIHSHHPPTSPTHEGVYKGFRFVWLGG
jgi:hypothetical protein